jgi:flagellar assembly factor FliW
MQTTNALKIPEEMGPPQAIIGAATADDGGRLIIESRFGSLAISTNSRLEFPSGLLGFAEFSNYALAQLDDPRFPQFKVLQSLNDHQLAFLVLPLDPEAGFIERADLDAACNTLSINYQDLAIMLVVTARKTHDGPRVTANLRAPLMIDASSRVGMQYVLHNERYPVRFQL